MMDEGILLECSQNIFRLNSGQGGNQLKIFSLLNSVSLLWIYIRNPDVVELS